MYVHTHYKHQYFTSDISMKLNHVLKVHDQLKTEIWLHFVNPLRYYCSGPTNNQNSSVDELSLVTEEDF